MPLNFTAIDFETANNAAASACSVGLVTVHEGTVIDAAGWFIDSLPESLRSDSSGH